MLKPNVGMSSAAAALGTRDPSCKSWHEQSHRALPRETENCGYEGRYISPEVWLNKDIFPLPKTSAWQWGSDCCRTFTEMVHAKKFFKKI